MEPFGVRLREATDRFGPLCGDRSHPELLTAWGMPCDPTGWAFARRCVEASPSRRARQAPVSVLRGIRQRGHRRPEETLAALRGRGR